VKSGADHFAPIVKRFGAATIARKVGVDESAVRKWSAGKAKPTKEKRAALRKHYGLSLAVWSAKKKSAIAHPELAAPSAPVAKAEPMTANADEPLDAATEAAETVRRLMALRDELEHDSGATPKEKAAVAAQLTSATRLLGKFTGATDVTPSQVLRSPSWRELVVIVVNAVRPFPGACDAVAKALRDYEGAAP
jgi:transcriptional regulator with XRE-family HTH domain